MTPTNTPRTDGLHPGDKGNPQIVYKRKRNYRFRTDRLPYEERGFLVPLDLYGRNVCRRTPRSRTTCPLVVTRERGGVDTDTGEDWDRCGRTERDERQVKKESN